MEWEVWIMNRKRIYGKSRDILKVLFQNFPWGTEESNRKFTRIAENWTRELLTVKQESKLLHLYFRSSHRKECLNIFSYFYFNTEYHSDMFLWFRVESFKTPCVYKIEQICVHFTYRDQYLSLPGTLLNTSPSGRISPTHPSVLNQEGKWEP